MGGSDVNRVRVCRVLAPAGGRGTLVISLICWHAFTKLPSSFYLVLFLHSRLLVHSLPFSDCTLIWRGLFDSRLEAAGNKPASLVFQSVLSHLPALSYCTFKVHAPLSNARLQNSPLSTPSVPAAAAHHHFQPHPFWCWCTHYKVHHCQSQGPTAATKKAVTIITWPQLQVPVWLTPILHPKTTHPARSRAYHFIPTYSITSIASIHQPTA